jgi:hypothetical protein
MPPRENTGVGYRRNGKKQACEPCRKGKLACDHGSPFCGRCTRRKTTSRCIYHPAPMTRNSSSAPPAALPSPQQTPSVASTEKSQHFLSPPATVEVQSSSIIYDSREGIAHMNGMNLTNINSACTLAASSPGQPKPGWKDAVFPSSSR